MDSNIQISSLDGNLRLVRQIPKEQAWKISVSLKTNAFRCCSKCSKLVVFMPFKFVLWLISAVLLVLHGKMDTNANEDAFGDYGLVQNSCALQFVRRRLPLCGVA